MSTLLVGESPLIVGFITVLFIAALLCTRNKEFIPIYIIVILALALMYRNPIRTPTDPSYIYSPSDGKVMSIRDNGDTYTINTFLSPLDVHVQYAPIDGVITKITHTPGGYKPADTKAADNNERLTTYLRTRIGTIQVHQIAGLLFRRAVSFYNRGYHLQLGQQMGMIKLSSRVDTVLPKRGVKILVKEGDHLQGAITKIAHIS